MSTDFESRLQDMERQSERFSFAIEQMAESQTKTNAALDKLVVIQERLVTLEARQQDSRELVSKSLDRFDNSILSVVERITSIETKMPQLVEMRGWILAAVGAAAVSAGGVIAKFAISLPQ